MNKRVKIILGIIVLVFVGITIWFFVLSQNQRDAILGTEKNLFPFGEINNNGDVPNTNNQDNVETNENQDTVDGTNIRIPEEKLRRISNFPTGGFTPYPEIEERVLTSNEINQDGTVSQTTETIFIENQKLRYSAISDSTIFESTISPYSITSEKIIENYLPNTEQVIFSNDGRYIFAQYWNKSDNLIESYLGNILRINVDVEICPFVLENKMVLGDEGNEVIDLHTFLNRNPQTIITQSGINSPGNEGNKITEATVIAIKNFQSLHELDIDGVTGPATRTKMIEVCNQQEEEIAKERFENLDKKYRVSGTFFPENIISADISPDNQNIFYLQNTNTGSIGVKENLLTGNKETILNTTLRELHTQWNTENNIQITTNPSYQAPTYTYHMNASSGDFHKSLPEQNGMTILPSRDNQKALISKTTDSGIETSIISKTSGLERILRVETLSNKCTWSYNNINVYCAVPNNMKFAHKYPDSWYQGRELFTDSIYKINSETMEETLVSDILPEYNENIDIIKINIDEKDEYLYFIDKGTEYLWSYRLFDV